MNKQSHSLRDVIAFALSLMQPRERRYLYLALILQVALGFADLLGVLILGIVSSAILAQYLGLPNTEAGILASVQKLFHFEHLHLIQMASIAVAIFVFKSLFSLIFSWKLYSFLAQRANSISHSLLDKFLDTPFVWVRKMDTQVLPFAFMEGINALVIGVLGNVTLLVADFSMMLILFVGLVKMSFVVTILASLLFGSLGFFLTRFLTPRIRLVGRFSAEYTNEGRNAILDIKEMFQEFPNREKSRFFETKARRAREKSSGNYAREQWLVGLPKNLLETAAILGIFLILLIAAFTGTTQDNVGMVTVFLGATTRILPAVVRMQGNWLAINRNVGYVDEAMPIFTRVNSVSKGDLNERHGAGASNLNFLRTGKIEFQDVSYRYPDSNEDVVTGLTFSVQAGEKIAIVGDSGAGKTTLANLILGLLSPSLGTIIMESDRTVETKSDQNSTGYLPQTPYIFSGSIRLNVCLTENESEIDGERLAGAFRDAQIGGFVNSLPDRDLSILGAAGLSLSGGEKQRLALARVLYLNPSIIVLDEPTSSLDSETDDFVSRTLTSSDLKSTVFVVAHKYSTVRSVNRILYLENGKILAFGTWEQIINEVPRFALQARLQGLM